MHPMSSGGRVEEVLHHKATKRHERRCFGLRRLIAFVSFAERGYAGGANGPPCPAGRGLPRDCPSWCGYPLAKLTEQPYAYCVRAGWAAALVCRRGMAPRRRASAFSWDGYTMSKIDRDAGFRACASGTSPPR